MPSSSIIKQTEGYLEDVLETIQRDYEGPFPVLCEMDRSRFVEEEQSLRKKLEEVRESEPDCSSWRRLLLLRPSPQAATKCLRDAEELHRRVKDDVKAKLRMRLIGRSNIPSLSSNRQDPARTPEINARLPLVEDSLEPPNVVVTSPLNMRCSLPSLLDSKVSEVNVNPVVHHHDHTSDINEAINSPLGNESHDGTRNSSSRPPTRRSPPPPPTLRRTALPSHSQPSSDTSSNSGSDFPRRSPFRRPAPPPPQSPRPLINLSFPSPARAVPFPDSAMISSMYSPAQDMGSPTSSMVASASEQASHGRRSKRGGSYVSKTNCVDIMGSTVEGMTINNGGTKNSGAVIHKIPAPPVRVL